MAQVSDSTTNLQQAIGSLSAQSQRPNAGETAENESNNAQQVKQTEDRVLISREAQEQDRGNRAEEGKRNVESLRSPTEQRADERGAAQKLNELNQVNRAGGRNTENGVDQIQPDNNRQDVNTQRNRTDSKEAAETRDQLRKEAADRRNPEVQLREFQNKDEVRIEPKNVTKSVEEVEFKRERAEAAQETAFETPSQRIIEDTTSSGTERTRSAENNSGSDQADRNRQPPNPTSVQTETGQNVDDLI